MSLRLKFLFIKPSQSNYRVETPTTSKLCRFMHENRHHIVAGSVSSHFRGNNYIKHSGLKRRQRQLKFVSLYFTAKGQWQFIHNCWGQKAFMLHQWKKKNPTVHLFFKVYLQICSVHICLFYFWTLLQTLWSSKFISSIN